MQITDRGRLKALENVLSWQEPGGFSLPEDVLKAAGVHSAALALAVPDPPALRHVEDVAALAVDLLERGEPVDPVELSAQAATARELAAHLDGARRLVTLATESAGLRALAVATALADEIIVVHLRPPFEDVLNQASALASSLQGADLNAGGWDATKSVRDARRTLSVLADRFRVIRSARTAVIGLAGQEAEYDTGGEFSQLQHPQALTAGYAANRPMPRPAIPESLESAVLWLVTDGASGKPWLPTTLEQDAAWLAVFGEALEQRRAASLSARAHAGMRV